MRILISLLLLALFALVWPLVFAFAWLHEVIADWSGARSVTAHSADDS